MIDILNSLNQGFKSLNIKEQQPTALFTPSLKLFRYPIQPFQSSIGNPNIGIYGTVYEHISIFCEPKM